MRTFYEHLFLYLRFLLASILTFVAIIVSVAFVAAIAAIPAGGVYLLTDSPLAALGAWAFLFLNLGVALMSSIAYEL